MADEQFYTILTNKGKAKIANATLLNSNVTLTTLKVGDGNGAYYNPTEEQTDLKNVVHTCQVGSISIDKKNPNWVVVETIIPGSVGGFIIREIGLFDTEGDMIAVGKYPETYKPVVANGASKDLNVRTIFEVSNAENVTLNINPSVIIATKEDINNLQEQITDNATQLKEMANPNLLINGGFQVWQRGTSFLNVNTYAKYTADRWRIDAMNGSVASVEKYDEGLKYTVVTNADFNPLLVQEIEITPNMRGKKITFSASFGEVSGNFVINLQHYTNGTHTPMTSNYIATNGTYMVTAEIPSNVEKLYVIINSHFTTTDGSYFIIKNAKLELGSKATPFYPRSYGEELALCQRYYEITDPDTEFLGSRTDGERFTFTYRYPVCKRIGATISFSHGGSSGVLHIFSEAIASQLVATVTKTNEKEVKWTMPVNTGNIVLGQGASAFGQIVADSEIY